MLKRKDKGVFIPVIILGFIVGLILGGFSNTKITGYGIWGPWGSHYTTPDWLLSGRGSNPVTIVSVFPKSVLPGESITINVAPGSEGARIEFKIYKVNELGYGTLKVRSKRLGSVDVKTVQRGGFDFYENKTLKYYTSSSWSPGLYSVEVYDIKTNDYVTDYFTIEYINPRSEDVIRSGFKRIIYGG